MTGKTTRNPATSGLPTKGQRFLRATLGTSMLVTGILPGAVAVYCAAHLSEPGSILFGLLSGMLSLGLILNGSLLLAKGHAPVPRRRSWLPAVLVPLVLTLYAGLIFLPNFIEARATTATNPCLNNQRRIESAIHNYMLAESIAAGTPVPGEDIIGQYLGGMPTCPQGRVHYEISGTVDDPKIVCPNVRDHPRGHDHQHP